MDNRSEVREFLTSRRAKITPERAGLPIVGQRRVPGLRRGEVAGVRLHASGIKHFRHAIVGDLHLAYESVDLRSEAGASMTVYAAEPGSPSERALQLLASWAATPADALSPTSRQAGQRSATQA